MSNDTLSYGPLAALIGTWTGGRNIVNTQGTQTAIVPTGATTTNLSGAGALFVVLCGDRISHRVRSVF